MLLHFISNFSKPSHRVWLYSFVFLSKASTYAVLFLFLSFLIQPFHQAMANEVEAEEIPVEEPVSEVTNETEIEESETLEEVVEDVDESIEDVDLVEEVEEVQEDVPAVEDSVADAETEEELGGAENETIVTESDSSTESVDDEVVNDSSASSTESEVDTSSASSTDSGEESVDEETATSTEQITNATSTDTTASSTEEASGDNNSMSGSDENGNSNSSDDTSDDQDLNNNSDTSLEDEDISDNSTNNDSEEDDEVAIENEEDFQTGDEVIEEGVSDIVQEVVTLTRQLVTEENYYQFSRQSCAPVGDGTFHCSLKTGVDIDPQAVVYADQDEDGDMEIYMRTSKGDINKITDNDHDDTSPDFDAESMSIVWQQLIDGRYQVMKHDLLKEETTQLTFSRTNSMEPKVSSEGIVWQMWDGNDWEIVYFDGKFVDQITDNEAQDVTPVIEDGYILWSILGGEDQEARVYSLDTKETLKISGHEGGAIANPRFVLVYDTMFDNGDIVTQGFDPATGLSAPISAQPSDKPIDIPNADPVGEIRALIQNKSSQKEQSVVTGELSDTGLNLASSTATSSNELNLNNTNQFETDVEFDIGTSTNNSVKEFELTEFDLVITSVATSSSLEDIADELPIITEVTASSTQ